ncbi:MAG: hypothetical protein HY872_09800 [Chloroflexi bacterium]|nr:hypothetical protein [Chloroflexota bacterium]
MQTMPTDIDRATLVARIDATIRELELLRRQLAVPIKTTHNLTEQLFGALGKGSWDEYDLHLDWARCSAP